MPGVEIRGLDWRYSQC